MEELSIITDGIPEGGMICIEIFGGVVNELGPAIQRISRRLLHGEFQELLDPVMVSQLGDVTVNMSRP